MKKLLILQHSEESPKDTTIDWCTTYQIEPVLQKVWINQTWPSLDDYIGVVICGGGMDVDQEEQHPWLSKEKLFIKNLLQSKRKTLGLCLGAQLIAEVLGAKVQPHTHWEVGWHTIELIKNPYFPPEIQNLRAFQWHGYTFSLPPGSTSVGASAACLNQGFLVGDHALAFQFHPESHRDWIIECAETHPDKFPKGPFVQRGPEISAELHQQPKLKNWYWNVLNLFFDPSQKGSKFLKE